MTLAITPTHASNKLLIEVNFEAAHSASASITAALFQDTTAGALAGTSDSATGDFRQSISFTHFMTAGQTTETTFKIRMGGDASGTTTLNGQSGARNLGGVMASGITISEIRV